MSLGEELTPRTPTTQRHEPPKDATSPPVFRQSSAGAADVPTSSQKNASFAVDERVEVDYKGNGAFYPARIAACTSTGTFDIVFDDGDREDNVPASRIRKPNAASATPAVDQTPEAPLPPKSDDTMSRTERGLTKGQDVEGNFGGKGKWYAGIIESCHDDGTFDILYADGDRERGVAQINIRAAVDTSRDSHNTAAGETAGDTTSPFVEGEHVEVDYQGSGNWYSGKIAAVRSSGKYDIAYDDGDSEVGVAATRIRRCATKSDGAQGLKPEATPVNVTQTDNSFRVGQEVEGNYGGKGKWYKGKIESSNPNGTFDIVYNDGDRERGVAKEHIRLEGGEVPRQASSSNVAADSSSPLFSEGQRVEVDYQGSGKWYGGKIAATRSSGKYDIAYDDGDSEVGVPATRIRNIDADASDSTQTDVAPVANDHEPSSSSHFHEGQEVEGNYGGKGKWYKGKIEACHGNNSFDILYADGDRERGVKAENIRSASNQAAASAPTAANANAETANSQSTQRMPAFTEGQQIEANYQGSGKWYSGKVAAVRSSGTYDITYDDGDSETAVRPENLRDAGGTVSSVPVGGDTSAGFTLDEPVDADYGGKGKWYPGRIAKINKDNGTYDILYDDGDRERGVPGNRIRSRNDGGGGGDSDTTADAPASLSRGGRSQSNNSDSDTDMPPMSRFSKGDHIEGNFNGAGKWYGGTISNVRSNGTYDIRYDDGDSEVAVPQDRIR